MTHCPGRGTELTTLLRSLEDLFGSALAGDRNDLNDALRIIHREGHLLPRIGPARTVNETLHLTSEPPFVSDAATRRWVIRAERCARKMRKRIESDAT